MADDPQKIIREKIVAAQQGGDLTQGMGGLEAKAKPPEMSMDKMLRDQAYRHRLQMDNFDRQIESMPKGSDRDLLRLTKLEAVYMFHRDQDRFKGASSPSTDTINAEQSMKSAIDEVNSKYGSEIKYPDFARVGEKVGETIFQ